MRLNGTQRLAICRLHEQNPQLSQQALAHKAAQELGLEIEPSQSTISLVLKRQKATETKRRRAPRFPELDQWLAEWVTDARRKGERVTCTSVKRQGGILCELLRIPIRERPAFSNGWFARFSARHGLRASTCEQFQESNSDGVEPQRMATDLRKVMIYLDQIGAPFAMIADLRQAAALMTNTSCRGK